MAAVNPISSMRSDGSWARVRPRHCVASPSPEGLVEFIKKQNGLAKIKDNKLIIRRDWKKNADKFKGAFSIAKDLAKIAASYEKNTFARN